MYSQIVEGEAQAFTIAAAGTERTELLAATVHLFTNALAPTPQTLLAAFTAAEATFDGYAASVVIWDAVGIDSGGVVSYQGSGPAFTATDGTVPNNIGGMWLQTAAMTPALVAYYTFPVPITIAAALDFIAYTITRTNPIPGNAIIQN